MTFEEYLQELHTKQSAKSYQRAVDHFLFHSKTKKNSSYNDIIDYMSSQNITSQRQIAALKKYFDYLIEEGVREDHPCKSLTLKKETRSVQFQELFTKEELLLLMDREVRYSVLEERNKAILSLLIHQGLTPANIEKLRVEDIDVDEGMVYIMAAKNLSRRTLELKSTQVLLMYKYMHETRPKLLINDSDKLFITTRGKDFSVEALNRMLRPLKHLFPSRNLNANTIRQSVITNWLNEDHIPMEDVQLLAGHKWLSSTEKYIRQDSEGNRKMINKFFPL